MKPRSTIALAGLLALLCLGYWGMTLLQEKSARDVVEAKKLFDFTPASVQTITIEREGERASSGMRDGEKAWKVTQPYPVRPNPEVWERVATALAELSNERTIAESPEDLEQYGLAKPVLKIQAKTAADKEVKLSFGALDPTKKFRYALDENGAVFLVKPDSFFELDRSLLVLRDRYPFDHLEDGITRLEFAWIVPPEKTNADASPEATFKETVPVIVELGADNQWNVLGPTKGLADQEMVQGLVAEIQYAVGRGYIDQPERLADYGLDPPMARVTVRCGKEGALQTIYYGSFERESEKGGVFVKKESSSEVFVVDAQVVTLFPKRTDSFSEKRVLTHPASTIRSLKYEAGPQTFTLENPEGKAWRLTDPPGMESDQGAVSRFIGAIVSAKGTNYYSERKPEYGLDTPAIRMTLTVADSQIPMEILVGAQVPNVESYYATQDTGAITTLDKTQVDAWRATYTDFVSKGLLSFKKDEVSQVMLAFEGTNYIFSKGERAWLIEEPRAKAWESQSDMDALLNTLETCIADAIESPTAPTDLAQYGLDAPMMTVRVTATKAGQGAGSVMLGPLTVGKISEADPHQRYASVAGRPEVFRIRQLAIEQIRDALKGVKDITIGYSEPPPVKIVE